MTRVRSPSARSCLRCADWVPEVRDRAVVALDERLQTGHADVIPWLPLLGPDRSPRLDVVRKRRRAADRNEARREARSPLRAGRPTGPALPGKASSGHPPRPDSNHLARRPPSGRRAHRQYPSRPLAGERGPHNPGGDRPEVPGSISSSRGGLAARAERTARPPRDGRERAVRCQRWRPTNSTNRRARSGCRSCFELRELIDAGIVRASGASGRTRYWMHWFRSSANRHHESRRRRAGPYSRLSAPSRMTVCGPLSTTPSFPRTPPLSRSACSPARTSGGVLTSWQAELLTFSLRPWLD